MVADRTRTHHAHGSAESALPPQPGEKEDSRRKTSYTALEAIGGGGDEKREAAAELQLDLDALLAEYESKDDYSSRKSRNRGPKEQEGEGEEDNEEAEEKESDDESDGEIDYEKEIKKSREELAARKELYRQLCAIERQNQMRCIELSEQSRANGNDVAQYAARSSSSYSPLFSASPFWLLRALTMRCQVRRGDRQGDDDVPPGRADCGGPRVRGGDGALPGQSAPAHQRSRQPRAGGEAGTRALGQARGSSPRRPRPSEQGRRR